MKSARLITAAFAAVLILSPTSISAATDAKAPAAKTETKAAPAAKAPAPKPAAAPAPAAGAPAASPATTADASSATPAAKPDATPEKQEWWQVLLAQLLQIFLVIAVPVLSTLIVSLLKRWNINVQQDQVQKIAGAAAGWAEQKALEALKEGKEKTSGGDKMKMALDFANGMAEQYKLKAAATSKLQELIESALGQEKIKAAATNGSAPAAPADPPA